MKFRFHWLLLAVAVVVISCEKQEYTSDSIKLLPTNKASPIDVTRVPGANALSHQDLMDIGLQLGRFPTPLGSPSDIKIESSNNGVVNAVSVGFSKQRANLVRRQGKGWHVLHISHIVSNH